MSAVDRKRFLLNIFMSQQDWLQKLHRVLQWLPYLNESLLSEVELALATIPSGVLIIFRQQLV